MTGALAIRTTDLGKKFRLLKVGGKKKQKRSSFLDFVAQPLRILQKGDAAHFWALKNISVEIKRGQCVALMGANGAGKSTFLKVLSRISEPSAGAVDLWGSVGSLLETGVGFHPELTGRENIFLSGAILGLKHKDITQSFDEIVDFSGLEKFIDEPVRTYSSGMKARLGFSVMAIQPHDTLLLDEVLSVGDLQFRHKCSKKIKQLKKEGRTLVVVSHNIDTTNDLCSEAIYFSSGTLKMQGKMTDVLPAYLRDVFDATESALSRSNSAQETEIRISDVTVVAADPTTNRPLQFKLKCVTGERFGQKRVRIGLRIKDDEENLVASGFSYNQLSMAAGEEMSTIVQVPSLPLSSGFYTAQIALYEEVDENLEELDRVDIKSNFPVLPNPNAPAWLRNSELRGVVIEGIEFEEVVS